MTAEGSIIPIITRPGIQRDGTEFDSESCIDGQWTRFIMKCARKMGGYRQMSSDFSGPMRQIYFRPVSGQFAIYAGSADALELGYFTNSGFGSGIVDITPAGFADDDNNMWQIDGMYDPTGTNAPLIFAIATPTLQNPANSFDATIYFGQVGDSSDFAALTNAPNVSGVLS